MDTIHLDYFLNDDVVFLAKDLLGKYVFTQIGGQIAGGIITETDIPNGFTSFANASAMALMAALEAE